MRLLTYPLVLHALWLGSSLRPSIAPADLTDSYLTCQPSFPVADIAGSGVLIEECAQVGKRITQFMNDHPFMAEELHFLGLVDRKVPKQLLSIDAYAYFLETQHGCQNSHAEKTHCAWMSQLRGEITELLANIGRNNYGNDVMKMQAGVASLVRVVSELEQTSSEMDQTMTEFLALESSNASQALSVLSVLSRKHNTFHDSIRRAEDLEADLGCPLVCIAFKNIREWAEQILAKGHGLEEALEGVKGVKDLKDEL